MLDNRRKFIEAAGRYYELSLKAVLAASEKDISLKKALVCTILASAGKSVPRPLHHHHHHHLPGASLPLYVSIEVIYYCASLLM